MALAIITVWYVGIGALAAVFGWVMAAYFVYRRRDWRAAWKSPA